MFCCIFYNFYYIFIYLIENTFADVELVVAYMQLVIVLTPDMASEKALKYVRNRAGYDIGLS